MIRFIDVNTREVVELAEDARVLWLPRAQEAFLASDGGLGEYTCEAREIKPGRRVRFGDRLLAYHPCQLTHHARFGWPLVPSKTRPGEMTLACPRCGGVDVTEAAVYPGPRTGPGEQATCGTCGHAVFAPAKGGDDV